MTRLAMSNIEMAHDMICLNSDNIENSVLSLYKSIGELAKGNYKSQVQEIRTKRQKMFC